MRVSTLKALAASALVAIAATSAASAADMPRKAPIAPVELWNWTGFYIGGNCGGAWARSTTNNTAPFAGFDNGVPTSYTLNDSGWTCGGQFGYNWQTGQIVFGLEGDQVKMIPVKTGISDSEHFEIISGLSDGQTIVTGGYKAISKDLEDGKKVKVGGAPAIKPEAK